ncbi:MAG TPA: PLP-dependent transferase [Motilibacterales bacterium]|nr:PLP-dependent transferase [Motilibacterales bacterium]
MPDEYRNPAPNHLPDDLGAASIAVAAGRPARDPGAPMNAPAVFSSTFTPGGPVSYARVGNPTWTALEEVLAALEGPGCRALSFASGMAAITAVADLVPVGGVVVSQAIAYSGTRSQLARWHESGRIALREVAARTDDLVGAVAGASLVWLETPTNPTLEVVDIAAIAAAAHASGAMVVVDSTFATPLGQKPLDLGADVVVHSATKYLAGHSDVLLGAVITRDPGLVDRITRNRVLGGGIPGPMEAWIALRGLRTFPLRWERSCSNAAEIARRCTDHPAVARVRHLGLPDDPGHALAVTQMTAFGAIVSLELHGGAHAAEAVADATRLWVHATSLGGVESTLERRRRWPEESPQVPDGLLRLSVGIEDVEDLWADLSAALDSVLAA